jgi:hypothetical protein
MRWPEGGGDRGSRGPDYLLLRLLAAADIVNRWPACPNKYGCETGDEAHL